MEAEDSRETPPFLSLVSSWNPIGRKASSLLYERPTDRRGGGFSGNGGSAGEENFHQGSRRQGFEESMGRRFNYYFFVFFADII